MTHWAVVQRDCANVPRPFADSKSKGGTWVDVGVHRQQWQQRVHMDNAEAAAERRTIEKQISSLSSSLSRNSSNSRKASLDRASVGIDRFSDGKLAGARGPDRLSSMRTMSITDSIRSSSGAA